MHSRSHTLAIHWTQIPENVDVYGARGILTDLELPLLAVQQDHQAWDHNAKLSVRAGLLKTTFQEEVETDWFGDAGRFVRRLFNGKCF